MCGEIAGEPTGFLDPAYGISRHTERHAGCAAFRVCDDSTRSRILVGGDCEQMRVHLDEFAITDDRSQANDQMPCIQPISCWVMEHAISSHLLLLR